MTINKRLLILFTFILTSMSINAQLSLILSDVSGHKGTVIEVGVSVAGFEEIVAMQYSINWDSTVLNFQAIENFTEVLPTFSDKEIGLVETASGVIRVAWVDNTTQGITLADTVQLFTLKFEVIGDGGINSNITISDTPIIIEFSNLDGSMVELAEVVGGNISVEGTPTALIYLEATNGVQLYQNEPNPFNSTTKITAVFPSAAITQFYITDITGKVVYQNSFKSVQGENIIEIGRQQLSTPGTFYYTLQSEDYQLSRKMILLP